MGSTISCLVRWLNSILCLVEEIERDDITQFYVWLKESREISLTILLHLYISIPISKVSNESFVLFCHCTNFRPSVQTRLECHGFFNPQTSPNVRTELEHRHRESETELLAQTQVASNMGYESLSPGPLT